MGSLNVFWPMGRAGSVQAVKPCPGMKCILMSMRTDSQVPVTALEVRGSLKLLPLPWVMHRLWEQAQDGESSS